MKNHITFAHLIKGTVIGRACGVLIPSSCVTDSRTQNLVFHKPCFILFGFSLVSQNKLWWRLQTLFFFKFYFWVRYPVAISVVTDGDNFTGDARESDHLFGCAKLMYFFFIFFLSRFFSFWVCVFLSLFIFEIIVCEYSSLFWYLE